MTSPQNLYDEAEEDRRSLDRYLEEYPNSIGNLLARGTRRDIEHVLAMVPDHEKALQMLSELDNEKSPSF